MCCYVIGLDENFSKIIMTNSKSGSFIFNGTNIIDPINNLVFSKPHSKILFSDYCINENNEIICILNRKPVILRLMKNLKYAQNFMTLRNFQKEPEFSIQNNILLYPFKYNLLHIIAIFGDLHEFDEEMNWTTFKKIHSPLSSFLSLDYQGQTCLDILVKHKNKE